VSATIPALPGSKATGVPETRGFSRSEQSTGTRFGGQSIVVKAKLLPPNRMPLPNVDPQPATGKSGTTNLFFGENSNRVF
jgi:hypothetical protein